MTFVVSDIELSHTGARSRLSAGVAGERLFWEAPAPAEARGEPFVCALLAAAMRTGQRISLPAELPLDPLFLSNVDRLQQVFTRWFPGLQHVPIDATVQPPVRRSSRLGTGYSGGVDSGYTMDALSGQIDSVLLIDGIEFREESPDLFDSITSELGEVVAGRGLELVLVRTNVKAVAVRLGARWSETLGGALASSIHAAGFASYQIAASNSWENLRPYGSHPLTDPLWSSSTVQIGHHGAELRRIDKVRYLAGVPDLLDRLRVCFQGTAYNCGRCDKCLMTMAALRAAGVRSPAVPEFWNTALLSKTSIAHKGDLVDWEELMVAGLEKTDPDLYRAIRKLVRRFRWRQAIRELDELGTGGRIRHLVRRTDRK